MTLKQSIKSLRAPFYKFLYPNKQNFTCPICNYNGPFKDKKNRLHAKCPKCGENERSRLQFLVLKQVLDNYDHPEAKVLHIAPEQSIQNYFTAKFKDYTTADKFRTNVDLQFDVIDIPFPDQTFDIVYASHILLYPQDDLQAIAEMHRILKPNGIAIIPMPIFAEKTVDDFSPEARWIHQPGLDYFQRYQKFFPQLNMYYSHMFPAQYQVYICDSSPDHPLSVDAIRREELVPISYGDTVDPRFNLTVPVSPYNPIKSANQPKSD